MTDTWKSIPVDGVQVADRVRYAGQEISVARVELAFPGREQMACHISECWHAHPAMLGGEIEVVDFD